jgi:hypothetical protein
VLAHGRDLKFLNRAGFNKNGFKKTVSSPVNGFNSFINKEVEMAPLKTKKGSTSSLSSKNKVEQTTFMTHPPDTTKTRIDKHEKRKQNEQNKNKKKIDSVNKKLKTKNKNEQHEQSDDIEPDNTNQWSTLNDSIKNYDSENEQIPLVVKKTPTSTVTPLSTNPSATGHHKKKATHTSKQHTIHNTSDITIKTALISPDINDSQVASKESNNDHIEASHGAENQGFNETIF